jgi:glycosyltransferase involved in cell wall biosynthesis
VRLTVDLRFDAADQGESEGGTAIGFHRIAAAARRPRELIALLRGRRYERVEVIEDELPPSAVQAVSLALVALVRSPRFAMGGRETGRTAFALRALAKAAVAVPAELAHTAIWARRLRAAASGHTPLPASAASPTNVVYLRVEPTLRWMGAYVGGAATHTTGVINGFADNGLGVEVFAPEQPLGTRGASFRQVPLRRVFHLVRGLTYTSYSRDVVRAAQGSRADFVYQRYSLGSVAGLELAERLGVPLVQEFNGSEIWVERNWGSGGLRLERDFEALERRNLLDASLIVVVSDVLKQQIVAEGIPAERVLVNPNGVDVERLARFRERSPAEWRRELDREEAPTVGFIGTFGLWHGVKVLPAMIDALREQRPDARWVVVGDGGLRADVERELRERGVEELAEVTGLVDHDRALALLAGCDVCVSPHVPNPDGTPFFGSPTKLFEYMGLGKPIVASALEQIAEVIEDERTGLLCPPGDARAAAGQVERLLGDPGLRSRLGGAALEEARETYSWAAHTRRILTALERGRV